MNANNIEPKLNQRCVRINYKPNDWKPIFAVIPVSKKKIYIYIYIYMYANKTNVNEDNEYKQKKTK